MTTYADMALQMSAYAPGCPSSVISNVARRIIIDLCARGAVWREYGAATTLVPATHTYTLTPTSAQSEIIAVHSASTTVSGVKHPIYFRTLDRLQSAYPSWPGNAAGDAALFTKTAIDTIALAPVPDTAGTLTPYVGLQPTSASTEWPTAMYNAHQRVIFHGVLHDLMMMPGRAWADLKAATYHGRQWTYLLDSAKARAEHGFNPSDVQVQMRPMA